MNFQENKVNLSIVIVNYNTKNMTLECINSIFENLKNISFEIILVDNASLDGSKELFEVDCRIKYIYNNTNLGFGKANNIALDLCRGDYILFLNSDTLIIDDSIEKLYHYINDNYKVGACGGNLFFIDGSPLHSFKRMFPSILDSVDILFFGIISKIKFGRNKEHNFTKYPIKVAYITGADLIVRKKILDELKGFSPSFFMYYEETELCRRIQKLGYSIMAVPDTHIIHLESKSVSLNSNCQKYKMLNESKKIYLKLQCGFLTRFLINFLWVITVFSRIILLSLSDKHRKIWFMHLKNSMPWSN